jgi:hypothetical protein
MSSKNVFRVLVLCQRREHRSEVMQCVHDIDEFVKSNLRNKSQPYTIEYMRGLTPTEKADNDKTDIPFHLNRQRSFGTRVWPITPEVQEFIDSHRKYYHLIILNTCPFGYMEYDLISDVLKDRGIISLNTFTGKKDSAIYNPQILNILNEGDPYSINNYFKRKKTGNPDEIKFRKITKKRLVKKRKQTPTSASASASDVSEEFPEEPVGSLKKSNKVLTSSLLDGKPPTKKRNRVVISSEERRRAALISDSDDAFFAGRKLRKNSHTKGRRPRS